MENKINKNINFSSKGIFVNNDWILKDAINKFGSWSRISLLNEEESLVMYSLIVNCLNISIEYNIRILQSPYIIQNSDSMSN